MTFDFVRRARDSDCRTRSRGLRDKTGFGRLQVRVMERGVQVRTGVVMGRRRNMAGGAVFFKMAMM